MPEPQGGASRWIMLVVVLAILIALMLSKTDESDESNGMRATGITAFALRA